MRHRDVAFLTILPTLGTAGHVFGADNLLGRLLHAPQLSIYRATIRKGRAVTVALEMAARMAYEAFHERIDYSWPEWDEVAPEIRQAWFAATNAEFRTTRAYR